MILLTIIPAVILGFILYLIRRIVSEKNLDRRMPPGPGFNLVRVFTDFGPFGKALPHTEILSKDTYVRFGKVFTLCVGASRIIFINDVDITLEMLVTKGYDFGDRPQLASMSLFTEGNKDIALSNANKTWKLHRKICLQAFRKFMYGEQLEMSTYEIFEIMVSYMDEMCKLNVVESSAIENVLSFMMYSLIGKITMSQTFKDIKDPEYVSLKHNIDCSNALFASGVFEDVFPYLLPMYKSKKYKMLEGMMKVLVQIFQNHIDHHIRTLDKTNPTDVLDCLLISKSAIEEEEDSVGEITMTHLRQTLMDIFSAGSDTSRLTQQWAIFFMALYPDVQNLVYEEIKKICGNHYPRLNQRAQLPYTDAAFHEVMRRGTIAALNLPHTATKDTSLAGYFVPKNTVVIANLYACHHDEDYWADPCLFKPERFLETDGERLQLAAKQRAFLPFSAGPRACLGQSVAKADNFIIFCLLIQRYEFRWPKNQPRPAADFFYKEFQFFGTPIDHFVEIGLRKIE